MNSTPQSMRDDLAFLRAIAEGGEGNYRGLAEAYCAGGLIYGGQMVLHAAQALGVFPAEGLGALAIGLGPTLVFAVALVWISRRNPAAARGSLAAKAIGSVFAAVGLSNIALIAVIGSVSWREQSLVIWLIYPCTVFILQGAAWLVAFMMRRKSWHGLVSAGFFGTGIGMALSIRFMPGYIAFAAFALLVCMALPGYLMLRQPRLA